jgi:hypothetical protein
MFGLKVYNPLDATKFTTLTPNVATVISSGRVTLSDSLNGDGTYGTDIDLPGVSAIPAANIGVLVFPVNYNFVITSLPFSFGGGAYIQDIGYMKAAQTYYTFNKATGAMTSWTAGNLTDGNSATFDHVAAILPVAFWSLMGGTTFTAIRLFAATCYLVYDSSAGTYIKVYTIGSSGVSIVDYMIAVKNYS